MALSAMHDKVLAWATCDGAEVLVVPPEVGDGETFYYEVTRYGEIWDGRAATLEEAKLDAIDLARRLVRLQSETGRNHEGPIGRSPTY